MTQPSFVPIAGADQVRPSLHLEMPRAWVPDRPAELRVPIRPGRKGLGTPGPDQGFALRLSRRFEDRLRLGDGESADDVLLGAALVASRRAALFGRAPTVYDLEKALSIWGFLDDPGGIDVDSRRARFSGAAHDYDVQRAIVDSVPDDVLRLASSEVRGVTFGLDDVHREFQATMRRFCEERIAPHAAKADRNATFPWKSFEACRELELPSLGVPAEYGGAGADMVTQAIMAEELARVCASTSVTMLISKLGMLPVMNWGSEELKRKYLPRIASGESQASYCLSEADAGSDVAAMSARAVRDGDSYVISGTKYWITNAGISDIYTVFAKTDPAAGHKGISCFVVEAGWGVKVAKHEDKLGLRASPTGEVVLQEVRVPAENLVGEEGRGFHIAMHTLDRSRPTIGAQAVGIAQGAVDYAAGYMKDRRAFGAPIADLQALRFMIADMAMRTEAARGLVYRACALVDDDPAGELGTIGAMAKCFASDTAMSVTTDAVQLLGGYGYTKDFPVERFMRDAKITQIYEGTNQIQRVVIAKNLLG